MTLKPSYLTALAIMLVASNASAEMIKERELLRRLQTAPSDAIVQYCRTNAPETIQLVDSGYAAYLSSFEKSIAIWSAEKPETQKYLESQIPSDSADVRTIEATINDIGTKILESVKQYDPHKYCPWMASKLKASTPDLILKHLHEYDARVELKLQENKKR